jgi:predicted nucleotidyltransferase
MTVHSLDLADKQELAFLAEMMAGVYVAAPDARFLLVGAMARDLLLYHAHGIWTARATSDVDLALAVTDWAELGRLRSALLSSGAFSPHPKVSHKVFHRGRQEIDLNPFGGNILMPDRLTGSTTKRPTFSMQATSIMNGPGPGWQAMMPPN